MACTLSKSPRPPADFTGQTGRNVTLSVTGTLGKASIKSGRYAGQPITNQFTIVKGIQPLELLIENSVIRDWTQLDEICDGAARNPLDRFRFDPLGPLEFFEIEGT